ncbi:hypothetical protein [Siminovitchia sp. FSL W7-1587]|uniref:hypothetical protein n=1 Tax=Siminovitchia sp. FSL W7-1587 TaxID=2954699 RepID=UPI0030D57235
MSTFPQTFSSTFTPFTFTVVPAINFNAATSFTKSSVKSVTWSATFVISPVKLPTVVNNSFTRFSSTPATPSTAGPSKGFNIGSKMGPNKLPKASINLPKGPSPNKGANASPKRGKLSKFLARSNILSVLSPPANIFISKLPNASDKSFNNSTTIESIVSCKCLPKPSSYSTVIVPSALIVTGISASLYDVNESNELSRLLSASSAARTSSKPFTCRIPGAIFNNSFTSIPISFVKSVTVVVNPPTAE